MLPSGAHFSISSDENIRDFLGYSIGNEGYSLESSYYVLGVKDFTCIISKYCNYSELGVTFPFFTDEDLKSSNPIGENEDSNPGQPGCKAQDLSPVCIAFLRDKGRDPS